MLPTCAAAVCLMVQENSSDGEIFMAFFKKFFLFYSENYRSYFREESDQIARQNLLLLKHLSLITAGLLLFFFLVTPVVLPNWTITLYHVMFLPASLLFWFISILLLKKKADYRYVSLACLLFQAVLFSFILFIDLLAAPNTPASFMPGLCIALPVLFIMPFHYSYGMMLAFEILYIWVASNFKAPFLARYDILNSMVGIAFSFAVTEVIVRLRLRDYASRMKYKQLSTLDALSGILNKMAWMESVKQYLWLQESSVDFSMAILDLDDFKRINDQLGHFVGDQILQYVGTVLSESFRATDLVGRFGGDEFVVLLKGITKPAMLEKNIRNIQERLSHITVGKTTIKVTFSMGIAIASGKGMEFETVFQAADSALYQAKSQGKNNVVIHRCEEGGHTSLV